MCKAPYLLCGAHRLALGPGVPRAPVASSRHARLRLLLLEDRPRFDVRGWRARRCSEGRPHSDVAEVLASNMAPNTQGGFALLAYKLESIFVAVQLRWRYRSSVSDIKRLASWSEGVSLAPAPACNTLGEVVRLRAPPMSTFETSSCL